MLKRLIALEVVLALLAFSPVMCSQTGPPQLGAVNGQEAAPAAPVPSDLDGWGRPITGLEKGRKSASAPRHDISGVWEPEPAHDPVRVLGVLGASAMPEDGKPEHQPPYTPLAQEALSRTKPSSGTRSVLPAETNDPVFSCEPQGMPREDLYEFRTTQILQTPVSLVMLYQFNRVWRVVWTDGREFPKDPDPRWYGYSVGKWEDDYTFVVQTSGTDERTWLDRAGRPHSGDLRVEERFHRVNHDHLELTVTIDDPKMYTKPWIAVNKLSFDLQPPNFDIREMICSPAENAEYNKLIGNGTSDKNSK